MKKILTGLFLTLNVLSIVDIAAADPQSATSTGARFLRHSEQSLRNIRFTGATAKQVHELLKPTLHNRSMARALMKMQRATVVKVQLPHVAGDYAKLISFHGHHDKVAQVMVETGGLLPNVTQVETMHRRSGTSFLQIHNDSGRTLLPDYAVQEPAFAGRKKGGVSKPSRYARGLGPRARAHRENRAKRIPAENEQNRQNVERIEAQLRQERIEAAAAAARQSYPTYRW